MKHGVVLREQAYWMQLVAASGVLNRVSDTFMYFLFS